MARIPYFTAVVLLVSGLGHASAVDKISLTINGRNVSAYRTADLEDAKREAIKAHKPIAWIATAPQLLDGKGTINLPNSRGATLHALLAYSDKAILVFMDAYEENHKVLQIVDDALHTPDPHYTPPSVVFLDPQATNVLATVVYQPDFTKRASELAKGLLQIKGKY